jgi:hypothetical protein
MAHADWKRYYAIAYDGTPNMVPAFFKRREDAVTHLAYLKRYWFARGFKPIGILRVRATKRNVELQRWLKDIAI